MDIAPYITDVADFPHQGVVFKDVSPLIKERLPELTEHLYSLLAWDKIDYIVGIESRGFIFGSALAQRAGVGFIAIRKKGKLPPPVIGQSYALEYGEDTLEIKPNDSPARVLLIDDVLATGGTLRTAMELCQQANYQVLEILVLINLRKLNKMVEQGVVVKCLLEID